ncbi:MAG: Oligopeptide-binding protein AppA [Candidatus Omnitrophica bacterium]|nr:Oligopeptide-binding protein AppA [Candidatus Omnitrophota bacterium]
MVTLQSAQTRTPHRSKTPLFLRAGSLFLGVCLPLATLAAASPVPPNTAARDWLVVSGISEPRVLLPLMASESASAELCRLLYNGLVKYDKDLRLTGDLAESWEVLEGGLVIIFHLRHDVRWHDGQPFTAADVEFTYRKLVDPESPTPYGGDFEKVSSLEVIDAHTVRVTYKEPFAPGLASWGMGIIPKHLLDGQDLRTTPLARRPIGTGPFKFRSWTPGRRIDLDAYDGYHGGRPGVGRYVYRVLPDPGTAFLELQTERVDHTGLTALQYARQTDTAFFDRTYAKYRYPSFGYNYIGYNLEDPLFADRRVRKALGLAIDKREIVDAVLMGLGRVSTGPFLPGTWAYDERLPETPHDPERARRMLAEAGWNDTDGDGWLDKDGRRFTFILLTNHGNEQRRMAAEIIQRRLKEVGIDMRIRILEWGTLLKEHIDKRDFQAVLMAWNLSRDPDIHDIFHSSKTAPGQFNFVGYRSPEADRLMEEGRRVFDETERAGIYRKLHRLLAEDEPYLFLFVADALPVVHRRFRGVEPAPAGIGHNLESWTVESARRRYVRELAS